jgi:predicted AlkP superfamily phosphohydrolase/phosphomutase
MKRVVLIGLDGATFTVLDPLMAAGEMPALRELVASGVRGPLRSVVPALTPPAWTSLMTGRGPGSHGIFDFFRRESASSRQIRFLTSRDVESETIWEMMRRHRMRATVLNFPLTYPPPDIDGYVVPGGWMPWRHLRLGCHPAGFYDRLKAQPWFNPRELAMDMAHEEKALEGCKREEYADWIELHIRREEQWGRVTSLLMREDPTELTAVLFDGVDKLQHLCWRFLDPALAGNLDTTWAQDVRERCLRYFRTVDGLIAQIVADAGPEATVLIASDHGFGPQVRTFFVNTWLAGRGDLAWTADRAPVATAGQMLGMGQLARHVYQLDWQQTRAYAPMPSGNGIHIVRRDDDHPAGVDAAEYDSYRARMIDELMLVADPQTGERVVAKVWRREDIFAGPNADVAPDLTLELTDGGLVSILAGEAPVVVRDEPTGTHRPEGVFAARGRAVRQGEQVGELSILDVAPFMLYSLGLEVPAELEGHVPEQALKPSALDARPVRIGGHSRGRGVAQPAAAPALDPKAEAEIMRRLQALGYVE